MSVLIFPESPTNGQIYPPLPIPGVSQYYWDADSSTWIKLAAFGGDNDDVVLLVCSDETSNLQEEEAVVTIQMPYYGTLLAARATVNSAPTGSAIIVDLNKDGASVLSTKLTIGASETTSIGNAYTISNDVLPYGSEISVDIDQVGSVTPGAGLKVTLYIRRYGQLPI